MTKSNLFACEKERGKMKKRILIVEDDNDINHMLNELLKLNGYDTGAAYSGTEALMCIKAQKYDLIILDIMLPGISGKSVLETIRKQKDEIPVIALSAIDQVEKKVEMLKNGADDYMAKPFNNEELLARIETVLKRNQRQSGSEEKLIYKDIVMDRKAMEVFINEKEINLTKNEYKILELLMSNPKKVFTKNNIFELVWEEDYLGEDNVINVHISNIRKKLAKVKPEEEYIQTVWGIGFKMNL